MLTLPRYLLLSACALLFWMPHAQAGWFDQDEPEFLPAEDAFIFETLSLSATELQARWLIAPGYYLYRHRLQVALAGDDNGEVQWSAPQGSPYHDEHFGDIEIYRDTLEIPMQIDSDAHSVTLEVRYQGCADAGLCYPPVTRRVTLDLTEQP